MPDDLSAYAQPIPHLWESDNLVLKNKAFELIAGQTNPYDRAKAIFDFVENHLTYREQAEEHSAIWAYNHRVGDCSEFTHLFSALCRAAEVPTRFVSGYGYKPDTREMVPHAFAFIYLPGPGWIPVDLTWNLPQGMFGELRNDHLILLTSDGKNLVKDSKIKIPPNVVYSPGGVVDLESTRSATRLVAVESTFVSLTLRGSIWKFSVKVKNVGTQSIDNVWVELQADETYFELPPAREVGTLGSGMYQMVDFDVPVKQAVENSRVTAVVTYHSLYGNFRAEAQTRPLPAASISPPPEEILTLLILLACAVGAIAAIAAALLRR